MHALLKRKARYHRFNMLKTLIVEDNADFRNTLREILENSFDFIRFEEAAEGEEAMRKIQDFLPDLVFMDLKLPGESGLDLTRKIKQFREGIVVIILTNYDLPEYREAARMSGADYFLSKGSSHTEQILALVSAVASRLQ
jgi:CheY-like chemotaxis protein